MKVLRVRRALLLAALVTTACDGPQSALVPAGRDAERIGSLFGWLAGGALIVWLAVAGVAVYAMRQRPASDRRRAASLLIVVGGVAVPAIVLGVLLAFGLKMIPVILAPAPPGALQIEVSGEQWWWRVRYLPSTGAPIELANEIRLPVGQRVDVRLLSPDVIHSFWVPSLAGKVDMIPGRVNRIALEPTRVGVYRGACAEYCGASHALMNFEVVVMEPREFERWLDHQATPAVVASAAPAARGGEDAFVSNGCGACHTIRGTAANGVIGPDLTHVGSRLRIGASMLPNDPEALVHWIARTEAIKPGVHMPSFGMLPPEDLEALAAWLERLK